MDSVQKSLQVYITSMLPYVKILQWNICLNSKQIQTVYGSYIIYILKKSCCLPSLYGYNICFVFNWMKQTEWMTQHWFIGSHHTFKLKHHQGLIWRISEYGLIIVFLKIMIRVVKIPIIGFLHLYNIGRTWWVILVNE